MITVGFGAPFTSPHLKLFLLDQYSQEQLTTTYPQLCGEQPQNLRAHSHYFPFEPPSSIITEQFAPPQTGFVSHGCLHSPTAPIRLEEAQRMSIRGSGSIHNNQVHNSSQYRNQTPQEIPCAYSPDLEQGPVSPRVPSVLPAMLQVSDSYRSMGKPEPWMNYVLGEAPDTCPPSSDWDTDLSASGFLRSFNDYEFPSAEVGTDLPRPGGSNFNQFARSPSVALPCSKPTDGSDRWPRIYVCRWLGDGALCNSRVTADRRSVVEHSQTAHGIRPGDEKSRELCRWEKCRTTLNRESLARHILTVHLKEGARCHDCGVVFAREDSLKRHLKGGLHNASPEKRRGTRQSPPRTMHPTHSGKE